MKKSLSFIIPIFNEQESITELYTQLKDLFKSKLKDYLVEIIFINDGSTDNSLGIIKDLAIRNHEIKIISFRCNLGKAMSLNEGFKKTKGDIVATMDADLQDDPKSVAPLIEKLNEGYDLVVGWKKNRLDPFDKIYPSKIFNFFVGKISNIPLHDFNSGLKIMKKEVARELYLYGGLHRFIPVLASQRGFTVSEVPVVHHPRKHGKSKYGEERLIRGFLDFLSVMFINSYGQRPLLFFGLLGTAGILIGLIFAVYLSILHFQGETIGRRPLLTFSMLLILAGLQLFATGFIADMIVRKSTGIDKKLPIDYESS